MKKKKLKKKVYKCKFCQEEFRYSVNLKNHMKDCCVIKIY